MSYIKVVQSGNLIEVYEYEFEPPPKKIQRRKCNHKECRFKARCIRFKRFRRAQRSIYRARHNFYRLVRSNLALGVPALLTLTMLEVVPIAVANKCFTAFFSRLRRVHPFGSKIAFIAVPEFQARGAVHYHILVWGLSDDEIKNERDTRSIQNQWGYGYVDIIKTDGSPKLAGYLAKYMSKTMQDSRLLGKKAYSSSRNLLRSVSVSSTKMPSAVDSILKMFNIDETVDNSLAPTIEKKYTTRWLGKGRYKLYTT